VGDRNYRIFAILMALATEFFDGFTARKFNAATTFGQFFDPIADKLFILIGLTLLVRDGTLTGSQLVLVCLRDIVVTIGTLVLILNSGIGPQLVQTLRPRWAGKATTTLQFVLLVIATIYPKITILNTSENSGLSSSETNVVFVLIYLTTLASSISSFDYISNATHYLIKPKV
jgi:phosphatidylglycerophosphate synthase